jgi:hypothetical protein
MERVVGGVNLAIGKDCPAGHGALVVPFALGRGACCLRFSAEKSTLCPWRGEHR